MQQKSLSVIELPVHALTDVEREREDREKKKGRKIESVAKRTIMIYSVVLLLLRRQSTFRIGSFFTQSAIIV